jgi:hypothetical protein
LQAERLTSRVGSISPTSSDIRRDFYSALPFDGAVAVVCAACIGLAGRICYEYRQLAETAEDPSVKLELFDLAAACEEVANNIEDRMPGG